MTPIKKITNDFTQALSAVVTEVVEGNESALKLAVVLTSMTKAIDAAKKQIEDIMLHEAESYGQKNFADYNAKFQIAESGVKYDYTAIESWNFYQSEIDGLREKQKEIEAMAKTATENTPYVDAMTGECITSVPRSSKTIVKITLNK